MRKTDTQKSMPQIFLGIDGGQSHTEALIADERGRILGRGQGGASNHAEIPGGRERLRNAIIKSTQEALENAQFPPLEDFIFTGAHCGMTGGAIYKQEIISEILKCENLVVGHDAPTALCGATAGKPGVVVIAGTGSVIYGENSQGKNARAGGLGFLFSDEGSGFWLAAQTIRLAIKEQDGLIDGDNLQKIVLEFFGRKEIRELTDDFYNDRISRDEIAKLARIAHDAAQNGNQTLRREIQKGTEVLCRSVAGVARRLELDEKFIVSGIGGMFRGNFFVESFIKNLERILPAAEFTAPRFGPTIGALLLAYHQADIVIDEELLANLENSQFS